MIPLEAISRLHPDACPVILSEIFAHSTTGLAILDPLLNYVWVNHSFATYTGVTEASHVGRPIYEIMGRSAWVDRQVLMECAEKGVPIIGQLLGVGTSYFPLESKEKKIGFLIVVDSETDAPEKTSEERKEHEQFIQQQEDRLQLALRGGKFGTWQLSLLSDLLIDASDICKQCFGFATDEPFTYKDIVTTIHPDDLPYVLQAVNACRDTGCEYQLEYRCCWRDGSEHWINAIAQPTYNEQGQPVALIGICQDITQRKLAEQEKTSLLATIREFAVMQAAFLRDVLASVTDGKLRYCQTISDLPKRGTQTGVTIKLTATHGLSDLRNASKRAAQTAGMSDERWQDLITAVSEAGMNAVVHAGGGSAQVFLVGDNCIQVWISDTGKGIELEHLPRATLEKGYTTTGTMGHGMKMMLQTADRVWLLTGTGGTTLVIEQDRNQSKRDWI